ncbi:unnamed protein product [Moneuplotes crassus]|uniref:Uncharacterized protein n=1 Tax=Euplotes crassus TaxID=5936 RepID=A0AAD1UMG0_EUPCR|nr:unnamed protein product [Moneuplotes crassus]
MKMNTKITVHKNEDLERQSSKGFKRGNNSSRYGAYSEVINNSDNESAMFQEPSNLSLKSSAENLTLELDMAQSYSQGQDQNQMYLQPGSVSQKKF